MYFKLSESNTSLKESESDLSSDDEKSYTSSIDKPRRVVTTNNILLEYNAKGTKSKSKFNDKKKIPSVMIVVNQCNYDVISKVADKFHFKEVNENENWDIHWSIMSLSVDQCKELKRFQKLNHIPGMLELCRKDLMARNLNRMLRLFPNDYNFFPKSWCIPAELDAAIKYSKSNKNKTFIIKPDTGSQGICIIITKSLNEALALIHPYEKGVCQVYVEKPFLIDGYKFDMRLYVLITSCDPLRIYIYKEGLIRFASFRYEEPNEKNMSNVFMHLTNYAINKSSNTSSGDSKSDIKRKLSWFNSYMKGLKYDVEALWFRIDEAIVKTILSVYPTLKHIYSSRFPTHNFMPACIELLGMDVLLDEEINPIVLEVNYSPSYQTNTELDLEVKEALFSDLFAMMNINILDKRQIMREDNKIIETRLLKREKHRPVEKNKCFSEYFKQEFANRGGFRLLYPNPLEHNYSKYLGKESL